MFNTGNSCLESVINQVILVVFYFTHRSIEFSKINSKGNAQIMT